VAEHECHLWHGLVIVLVLFSCSIVGCTDRPERAASPPYDAGPRSIPERALVRANAWQSLDAEHDPFADHRPEHVECGIGGYYAEYGMLEIDTAFCNYLAIEQPSLLDLKVGDELVIEVLHYDLIAPEPAEAHIALSFDGELQWETEVVIPQPAGVLSVTAAATRALAVGDSVQLHLHNHGQNTWQLTKLSARVR
jgi:hypothetical protein